MVKKSKASPARPTRTAILVLGMHRSGTSALAGVLSKLGCALPTTIMKASAANPKGFFESTAVRDLNDEILASGGSSWDDFQPFNAGWLRSPPARGFHARTLELLAQEFRDEPLIVLKDPRICRLVPFWTEALEAFGCAVRPILTVRNPNEVARSLQSKKQFTGPLSQMIWLRHALDAEAATRGMRRYHTSYETLIRRWPRVVDGAAKGLGVDWPRSINQVEVAVESFLSAELRHHQERAEDLVDNPLLVEWLRDTFAILSRWAVSGEEADDHPRLDSIRQAFDEASRAFARLVMAEREERRLLSETLAGLAQEKTALEKSVAQHATSTVEEARRARSLETDLEALKGELASRRTAEAAAGQEARAAKEQLAAHAARMATLEAELNKKIGSVKQLQQSVSGLEAELDSTRSGRRALEAELAEAQAQHRQAAEDLAASRAGLQEAEAVAEARDRALEGLRVAQRKLQQEREASEALRATLASRQEELAAAAGQLEAERQRAVQQAEEAARQAATLAADLATEQKRRQALKTEMAAEQGRRQALESGLAERETALAALQREAAQAAEQAAEQAAARAAELAAEQGRRQDLESGLAERDTALAALQREAAQAADQAAARAAELAAELSAEQDRRQALESGLVERDTALAVLQREAAQAAEQAAARAAELAAELTAEQDRRQALESGLAERDTAIAALQREAQAETARRDAELAQLAAELARTSTALDQQRAETERRAAALAEAQAVAEGQARELAALTLTIVEREREISRLGAEMQAGDAQAEQQRSELQALRDQLAQAQSALVQRQHESETTAAALSEAQTALARRDEDLAGLQALVQGRDAELGQLRAAAEARDRDLAEVQAALAREAAVAVRFAADVEEARAAQGLVEERLQERFREIATLTQFSVRQQSEIAQLTDRAEVLAEKVTEARVAHEVLSATGTRMVTELAGLKVSLSGLRHELALTARERDAYAQEVRALRASTSWYLTAPLRRLVSLVRRR